MKSKTKLLNKNLEVLLVLVALVSTFFTSSTRVQVSTLTLDESTCYYYIGVLVRLGYMLTQNIYVLKQDSWKIIE
ncbi:hypothetical protein DFW37_00120 [Clostridioides difficile]|nr:hypothetical protein [Clostridioides difficile]